MQSSIYSLSTPIVVTFEPPGEKVYDPETGKYTAPEGEPIALEVFLLRDSASRSGVERPGLDEQRAERLMQIVGTKGSAPLKLPDTLKAGDTGLFTEMGQQQTLKLGNLVPAQIPDVADDVGWLYQVTVEAVG